MNIVATVVEYLTFDSVFIGRYSIIQTEVYLMKFKSHVRFNYLQSTIKRSKYQAKVINFRSTKLKYIHEIQEQIKRELQSFITDSENGSAGQPPPTIPPPATTTTTTKTTATV